MVTTRGLAVLVALTSLGCGKRTLQGLELAPSPSGLIEDASGGIGDAADAIDSTSGVITIEDGSAGATEPQTCAEAAVVKSHVGCEFWPTVTFNPVYSVFDFAAVVANVGRSPADVKVEQHGSVVVRATVQPGGLEKIYLPWVSALKGKDFDACTRGGRPTASVRVNGGAYHLTSDVPLAVWQFNPLEYKAGVGGPPGKDWTCPYAPAPCNGNGIDCLSVTNGASLLLPTSVLTGTYRLFGSSGARGLTPDLDNDTPGAYAITATHDGTQVTVALAKNARIAVGSGVAAPTPDGKLSFSLDQGDVVELLGAWGASLGALNSDLSGSLVVADQPIQIISLVPITCVPSPEVAGQGYPDHVEESLLPAEALGDRYVVGSPSTALGKTVGHYVRFYGNFDGTDLGYQSGAPPVGAPTSLAAGEVVEIGPVQESFEVFGNHSFAVASFLRGAQVVDPINRRGDPSMSFAVAVAQFRSRYTFLAPTDYDVSFADILIPNGTAVKLDGKPLTATPEPIAGSDWSIVRQQLSSGMNGAHRLEANEPVSLQVIGFGHATSYYYPGGLNLNRISLPPEIAK
jgi:hypothetical protein